jgi:hypothetical protein
VAEAAGLMDKLAPLKLVASTTPPEFTLYQSIELPAAMALRLAAFPKHIAVGETAVEMGAAGKGFTVSETATRVLLTQVLATVLAAA